MDKKNENISNIEELINQLEKISLSPIPLTNQDSQNMKKDVNRIIMKIVSKFDLVLSHKIRFDILTPDTNHYWSYVSKYYQIPSVKFCNLNHSINTAPDKGKLWLLLSITEKSLNESIKEIYNQNFDKKFYDKNSIINTYKKEIIELCSKLNNIYLFDTKTEMNEEYLKYKTIHQKKEKENLNDEIDFLSPIMQKPNEKHIEVTECPIEVIAIDKKNTFYNNANLNSLYFSRATIDLQLINNDQNDINSKLGMDSLFLAIESDDYTQMPTQEGMNYEKPSQSNLIANSKYLKVKQPSFKINDEKQCFFTKLSHSHQVKDNINITKICAFQSLYKEEFYSFKKKTKQSYGILKKQIIDYRHQSSIDDNGSRNKNDLILNPNKLFYYPFDGLFKVTRRTEKNSYTKKDVVLYNNKEIAGTNSVMFYLNTYYQKEPFYHFITDINRIKPVTLESQNYQCAFCNHQFQIIFSIPIEKIYWCCYYLRYACSECISEDYSIIPAYILKSWSFKKFTISNKAKQLLQSWYKYPIIYLKQNAHIIKKCEKLQSALLIKRKIHKIFDLIKCEKGLEFAINTLGEYQYLMLRENILSLQDLVEINELTFFKKLREFLHLMQQHILSECDVCLYQGGKCIMCMSKELIYAFDIENVIYCNDCRKMFHKKCCAVHPCIINR